MKRIATFLMVLVLPAMACRGQEYEISTNQTDSFSVALVKLLNCAVNRFEDCKGRLLRRTSLMGDDFELTIPFPGSAAGIVRYDDWIKNAYIEFRGYKDKKSREEGIKDIVAKIKKTFGARLRVKEYPIDKESGIYALSFGDEMGSFAMTMELFGGSSSAAIYLLEPDTEDDTKPKTNFVLLKIYPGVPSYYFNIQQVDSPDESLGETIRRFMKYAESDFDSLPARKMDPSLLRRKGRDTISVNGNNVLVDYGGSNYKASLKFPGPLDSTLFSWSWLHYHQVMEAAIVNGTYFNGSMDELPYTIYLPARRITDGPSISMELKREGHCQFIVIEIRSNISHPTKRGWNPEDD